MTVAVQPTARPPSVKWGSTEHRWSLTVRPASSEDSARIGSLLDSHVASGAILRREAAEIEDTIGSFAVATDEANRIAACAALVVYSSRLAEIRSVAGDPEVKGRGAGRAVVEYLTDWASRLEIERVFLLTRNERFFARVGYISVDPARLPDSFLIDHVHAQGRTARGKTVMIRDFAAEF